MLKSTYNLLKEFMSLESNISLAQLILGIVGTLITVIAIVFSSYLSLKVENGVLTERVSTLEKKVEKNENMTAENYKEIIKVLGEIKLELKDKANRTN